MAKKIYAVTAVYVRLLQVEVGEDEDPYEVANKELFFSASDDTLILDRLVMDEILQFCNWHVMEVK